MREIFGDFLDMCFPNCCAYCNRALMKGEEVLCLYCESDLPRHRYFQEPLNPVVYLFLGKVDIEEATAVYSFRQRGMMQKLMHEMKYRGRSDVAERLGRIMAHEVKKHEYLQAVTCIVPVPLHKRRLQQRGYNQSSMIAKGLSTIWKKPVIDDNLWRHIYSKSQTKKNRMERWDNVNNIFKVRRPEDFIGEHVLLLDDVVTTGSTLEACAVALKNIPNVTVSVLALAYPVWD